MRGAASSWAVFAGVTALANYVLGGPAFGYLSVGLLTALTPLAIVSGAVPLAGACYGVGVSAARGLNRGMLLIPLFLAWMIIAPPPWSTTPVDLAVHGAFITPAVVLFSSTSVADVDTTDAQRG